MPIEIEQIAQECLAVRLKILDRAVSRIYDQELRPFGLRLTQMNVLVAVGVIRDARPERICRTLAMEKSTFSRTMQRLSNQGYLEIKPGPRGKSIIIELTTRGRKLLEDAGPAWQRAQERARELLGETGVEALYGLDLRAAKAK
jgi:DNA-binding MarR family transcriptional regulator